jgi:lysozyme family protein
MEQNFQAALSFALRPENDGQHFHVTPGDVGGATNEGIIWSTFVWWEQAHGNRTPTLDQFKNMSEATISEIYHGAFWCGVRCPELPSGPDLMLFNLACSGPGSAVRRLQEALHVTVDGFFGPRTLRKALAADPVALIDGISNNARVWFASRPTAPKFLHGWLRRLADAEQAAELLIR